MIDGLGIDDIFAYPTEGVWGLGANALSFIGFQHLNKLKQRSPLKPMVCVTAFQDQINHWVDFSVLNQKQKDFYALNKKLFITFMLPASKNAPAYCVYNKKIALRLTDHSVIAQLSEFFQAPILSTSANITGEQPLHSKEMIKLSFPSIRVIDGELGVQKKPSSIYDLLNEQWIRS
jgi:L-threonylcarbamoyladenylate synthase